MMTTPQELETFGRRLAAAQGATLSAEGDWGAYGRAAQQALRRGHGIPIAATFTPSAPWLDVGPHTHMPGSKQIYTFLDVEDVLSHSFWSGWASAVFNFVYRRDQPFYEAAYINPNTSGLCSFLSAQSGSTYCFAIWSDQPENASNKCQSPG